MSCATHLGITFLCTTILCFPLLLLLSVILSPSFLMSSLSPLQLPANFCSFEISSLASHLHPKSQAPGHSSLKSFHTSGGPSYTHPHPMSFMADLYAHESHQIELGMPQFGSEPKFEPELFRTRLKFGPRFGWKVEPDHKSSSRFEQG